MFGQITNKIRYWKWCSCILIVIFAVSLAIITPQEALAADDRLAGADRYRTAVRISQEGWKESDTVILVRGDDFADALCAGPLAKMYNAPILFTEKYRLNSYILDEIKRLQADNVIIIGGYGAISRNIDETLDVEGIGEIERIYGDDRYETSVKIAQRMGSKEVALATGLDYADALSISTVAAQKGFSILLTNPDSMPDIVKQHLKNYKIEKTYVIGGQGAVSKDIENQIPSPLRFAGENRYETNRLVLEHFAKDFDFNRLYTAPGEGADNYTYALAGVPLAVQTSSPILLNSTVLPEETKEFIYGKMTVASEIIALGGEDVVPSMVLSQYNQGVDKVLKSVFDQQGVYGLPNGMTTISGNLVIEEKNVTVQNTIIEGDLVLGQGIGNGTVGLRNVLVKGRTTIRGGWDNRITGDTFLSASMVVDIKNGRKIALELVGKSKIGLLKVYSSADLDDSKGESDGFMNAEVIGAQDVTLRGKFNTVNLATEGMSLGVNADLTTLNAKSGGYVWGPGKISTANVTCNGLYLAIVPSSTKVAKDTWVTVGGKRIGEGTYSSSQIAALQLEPISDLKATSGNGHVSFTFSKATDATNVSLRYSTDGGTTWSNAVTTETLTKDSSSATATGLTNGQQYRFKLVVTGGIRAGDSNVVIATP